VSSTRASNNGAVVALLSAIFILVVLALVGVAITATPTFTDSAEAESGPLVDASTVVPTSTPSPTSTPTPTLTDTPLPSATPEPSLTSTPESGAQAAAAPGSRPQPDGVQRTARVPILMYHYISAPPDPGDRLRVDLSVLPENFDAQMRWLAENNYHTITLTDLYTYLAVGAPLPENPIILTFDDGYVDHYENAFPILQRYGFTGAFFVLAGPADVASPRYLTWEMIAEMSAAGQDVQVHGRAHIDLRRRSGEFLFFQIVGARQAIEAHTGKPAPFFAYPAGQYDADVLRFLSERDFWMAVTTEYGRDHSLDSALELGRVRIRGGDSLQKFISRVMSAK
jgi:peptidoglycan/xylan/chitin deacetylase (PgdA/CDA1 family)